MDFKHWKIPKAIHDLVKDHDGKIITRFPPEPSGYLHIGHAKALFINFVIAKTYHGKMIMRFDDTNPLKESCQFENSILEDIKVLDVVPDTISHTSDYFDLIIKYADLLVDQHLAYVDDTDKELMMDERAKMIESLNRLADVDTNRRLWNDMKTGSKTNSCLRLKINMKDANACMRDPTIFRCISHAHHKTDDRYKVYPTYDFACPIVDSIEDITHVFRSCEFSDRDDQYKYILNTLSLRTPILYSYGKLNFQDSVMGKRKIKQLIDEHKIDGWDDPRLYTIRGAFRRGLHIEALKHFLGKLGFTKNSVNMTDDMIWAINKQYIDKISTRYTVLDASCKQFALHQPNGQFSAFDGQKIIPRFIRNTDLGNRELYFSSKIFINLQSLKENEEFTLLNWTNVVHDNGTLTLNPNGDYKTTDKKLLWLSADHVVPIVIKQYSGLMDDCKILNYIAEAQLKNVKKGDYVQLLKMGYYICDREFDGTNIVFIEVPT